MKRINKGICVFTVLLGVSLAAAPVMVRAEEGALSENAMIGKSQEPSIWGGGTSSGGGAFHQGGETFSGTGDRNQGDGVPAGQTEIFAWDPSWPYAQYSQIHSSSVNLYHAGNSRGIVVAVNAGHGTEGGSYVQTLCHPDGTPKVTGGSTSEGATYATAVSSGTTMLDGTEEARVTLSLALILKEKLLEHGYDVLMIRESEDAQLDNIARTVFANQYADCHLALHYDSTEYDKGFFYMSVPDVASYRSMEPVASCWPLHEALGQSLVEGVKKAGAKVFDIGSMPMDLTQTSYSTIPSVDVEVGDRASDCSSWTQTLIAEGILAGLDLYFERP